VPNTLELAVIVPTLNERDNVAPLVQKLDKVLAGVKWEVVFVDDDSSDGTSAAVRELSLNDPRVRIVHRVHRRGLSSACYEGMLATAAPYLAVIDGDMQHDESLLPRMLENLKREKLDLVIGSRNLEPEGMGEGLSRQRVRLSQMGAKLAQLLRGAKDVTDPMSGFFLLDRRFLDEVIHRTSGIGFKVLLDLVASSTRPVRFLELPYQFRKRLAGESKLDLSVSVELLYLIADKMLDGMLPVRYLMFAVAGVPGLMLHLLILGLLTQHEGEQFLSANVIATMAAMTLNFFVNNRFTYRDQRLRGSQIVGGLAKFYVACSIGAVASFGLAQFLYTHHAPWWVSGLFGMVVASVWNFAVTGMLAWRRKRGDQPYN